MKGEILQFKGKTWYDVNAVYEAIARKRDKQTIRYWIRNNKVPSIKIGGKRFIEEDIVKQINEQLEKFNQISF